MKNRYAKSSEKQKQSLNNSTKRWRANNPDKIKEIRKKTDLKRKQSRRETHLLSNYNLTLLEYNKLVEKQKNLCLICNRPEKLLDRAKNIRPLVVDHCHTTGKIRGLLCASCNLAIGNFEDRIDYLENAILYLRNSYE